MEIEVRLYNQFKRYAPGDRNVFTLTLPPGASVGEVCRRLRIPPDLKRTVLLDGRRAAEETAVEAGATLVFFSPVSGG